MGRSVGDAVERAKYPPLGRQGAQLERLIQALPAAIYTTDADGRITFFNEAAADLWGRRPEIGKSEFCGSWKLYWPDGTPLSHGECPMAIALKEQRVVRRMEVAWRKSRRAKARCRTVKVNSVSHHASRAASCCPLRLPRLIVTAFGQKIRSLMGHP
jgi:PAS domain-containing protein